MDLRAWRVNRGWLGWRAGQKGRRGLNKTEANSMRKAMQGKKVEGGTLA
jgi:hypothetical protein